MKKREACAYNFCYRMCKKEDTDFSGDSFTERVKNCCIELDDTVKKARELYKGSKLSAKKIDDTKPFSKTNVVMYEYVKPDNKHSYRGVRQYLGSVLVEEYKSRKEASDKTGISWQSISECAAMDRAPCITPQRKTAGGFIWVDSRDTMRIGAVEGGGY